MVTIPVGNVKHATHDFTTIKIAVIYTPRNVLSGGSFIDFFSKPGPYSMRKAEHSLSCIRWCGPVLKKATLRDLLGDALIATGQTMLRIDLAPLQDGVHQEVLNPEVGAVGLDPERFADLRVTVTLDLFNDRVLATLQASATATLECDRTLVPFEQRVEGTYRILFVPPTFSRHEDEEDGIEEVQVLQASDHVIDLAEAVYDTVLLAVPTRKVAPGAEDLEIQTVYGAPEGGAEAAIDPRWEVLRSLHSRNKED